MKNWLNVILKFFTKKTKGEKKIQKKRVKFKTYELRYNQNALFKPWDVVEVVIEGVGYKQYQVYESYERNADALSCLNRLNKV